MFETQMHPVEIICFKRGLRYWYQPIPAHKYLVFVSKLEKKVITHSYPALQRITTQLSRML